LITAAPALAAEGIEMPAIERPKKQRTYNAHQAVEYAKSEGVHRLLIERIYRAFWAEGREINRIDVLKELATGIVKDLAAFEAAILQKKFRHEVVVFDDPAYANGVYNVPTFFIGGKRYAEQPYTTLSHALRTAIEEHGGIDAYSDIAFPSASKTRPYVYIDMVSTIDGKILSGGRGDSVHDLGSAVDHRLMKRLEASADAVLVGAQTLRATSNKWNPATEKRIVITNSGDLPFDSAFLQHGEPIIATSGSSGLNAHGIRLLRAGGQTVDLGLLLERLRGLGIERLLVLGGSELNAALIHAELVDELFLTVAPKVRLGRDIPTYADGHALPRPCIQQFSLVEHHAINDEIFLRYRRKLVD
jgi:riboflavin biosynthesis pyrimidine reductase